MLQIISKILILQGFWLLAVTMADKTWSYLLWPLALVLIIYNYRLYRVKLSKGHYTFLLFFFVGWGVVQDYFLYRLEILQFSATPFWLNSLWIIFLGYYGDVFNKLKKYPIEIQSLLGALGGPLSYYGGVKLANIMAPTEQIYLLLLIVSISWAIFFPLTMYLYYNSNFWNSLLDKSVYFSFDSSGFKRHKALYFTNENFAGLAHKQVLVTGGTGGIGKSLCESLAKYKANTIFTGRNTDRGKQLSTDKLTFVQLDMTDWDSFSEFVKNAPVFDRVVLNAGGMPEELELNPYGVEHQAASQLFGHLYLLRLLRANNKLNKNCRITWVSSGGMYLKQLSLKDLLSPKTYDKVAVYANVKRAQITLVEQMSVNPVWSDYQIFAMHPGWVGTEGVKNSLPIFYKFTKSRLRDSLQGADTILWLQGTESNLTSGKFYFDRKIVSPYISNQYSPTTKQRVELLEILDNYFARII